MQSLHYYKYRLNPKEWCILFAKAAGLLLLVGYLCFNSFWLLALLPAVLAVMAARERKVKIKQRKKALSYQFKDAIVLIYSFMAAGSTLEDGFVRTTNSLMLSYKPSDDIVREFTEIGRKLSMNITIEKCLDDFARRSDQEDIRDFAQVVTIAKRSGGSMTAIIKNSVDAIKSKLETEAEIQTLLAGKENEFRIMVCIPAALLLYMRLFSAGFLDVLYLGWMGPMFMSVCLAVYAGAIIMGKKVLNIKEI